MYFNYFVQFICWVACELPICDQQSSILNYVIIL